MASYTELKSSWRTYSSEASRSVITCIFTKVGWKRSMYNHPGVVKGGWGGGPRRGSRERRHHSKDNLHIYRMYKTLYILYWVPCVEINRYVNQVYIARKRERESGSSIRNPYPLGYAHETGR